MRTTLRSMSARSTSAHTLTLEAIGVAVDLEITGADLADAVERAWVDARIEGDHDAERPRVTLTVACNDQSANVTGSDVDEVLHRLSPAVTLAALEARAGELILLHAAALANPETGATAVLVAASGTGKTTASQAFGTELVYLSDETAGITEDGEVLRYRKPLSIVEDGHLKAQIAASERGLSTGEVRGRLAALILLDRSDTYDRDVVVEPIETVDALALLAPQASALARTERPLHRLADVVRMAGGLRRVRYRESADIVPVISQMLGTPAQ